MVSRSLERRKKQAWRITFVLIALSTILHIFKGWDWEESLICLVLLAILLKFRSAFWAENDRPSARQGMIGALGLFFFALVYGPIGFWLLRNRFSPHPTLLSGLQQTSYLFFNIPAVAPFHALTRHAAWFEDSLVWVLVFAAGYGIFMLLRPVLPYKEIQAQERSQVRALLQQYGGDPLSFYVLLPDKHYLFDTASNPPRWAIAYRVVGRHAIALGNPVGDRSAASEAIRVFCDLCSRNDWLPVFYQVTGHLLANYKEAGFRAVKVGEDALLSLPDFVLKGKTFQDLRTGLNKAQKLGILCEELKSHANHEDVLQMAEISAEWLRMHRAHELTFSMGYFDPASVLYRSSRYFLARDQQSGRILGFVSFVPIHRASGVYADGIRGWGLDLMRRREDSMSGLIEFLIASAVLVFQHEGAEILSLGLSALSDTCPTGTSEAVAIAKMRKLLFERFNRFYSFKGLHAFKNKFAPQWEPRYLIYQNNRYLLSAFNAVLRAHNPPNNGISRYTNYKIR
jgi:phosphatidylglycerol lysyltransferase